MLCIQQEVRDRDTAQRRRADPLLIRCRTCGNEFPLAHYSPTQRNKPEHERRCRACAARRAEKLQAGRLRGTVTDDAQPEEPIPPAAQLNAPAMASSSTFLRILVKAPPPVFQLCPMVVDPRVCEPPPVKAPPAALRAVPKAKAAPTPVQCEEWREIPSE